MMPETPAHRSPSTFDIEALYLQSKTGNVLDCEDVIHKSEHFVAVIDGVTAKTKSKWNGLTPGQVASELIDETLARLPPETSARQAVDAMTAAIHGFYIDYKVEVGVKENPTLRASASFAALSKSRREVWIVGDCQALIGQEKISPIKLVDRVLADVRALYLELQLISGVSVDQLMRKDPGRELILPVLQKQALLQNNLSAGGYWYPAIDGFPVPDAGIIVKQIPPGTATVVLATDGYPDLKPSLGESEEALQRILETDPLMYQNFKSTKGKLNSYVSFDDRAYVKMVK